MADDTPKGADPAADETNEECTEVRNTLLQNAFVWKRKDKEEGEEDNKSAGTKGRKINDIAIELATQIASERAAKMVAEVALEETEARRREAKRTDAEILETCRQRREAVASEKKKKKR